MRGISITRAGLALMGWLAVARVAHAQETLGARLQYTAASGCPARDEFEQRLRARMRSAASGSATLRVRLEAPGSASLRISEGERVVGERSLSAASCSEAADALAFVAALLLEEHAQQERVAEQVRVPEQVRSSPRVRAPKALPARVEAVVESAPADSSPEAPRQEEVADSSKAAPREQPRASALREPSSEPTPARAARELEGWLAAGVLLATGVTPTARPGLDLQAGLAIRRGPLTYSSAIGARAVLPEDKRSPDGDAQFRWASATLDLCAGPSALQLDLCLDVELGRIRGEGRATQAQSSQNSTWYALGPSLRARVPVWRKLSLAAAVGLPVPLTRDLFVVAATPLHRVPSITFRASLGLAIEFE